MHFYLIQPENKFFSTVLVCTARRCIFIIIILFNYYPEVSSLFTVAFPDIFPEQIHSQLRGEALGTWLQAEIYAGATEPTRLNKARELSNDCLAEFTTSGDKSIRIFSNFLFSHNPNITPQEINRNIILDYLGHLVALNHSDVYRHKLIADLREFLELCCRNE